MMHTKALGYFTGKVKGRVQRYQIPTKKAYAGLLIFEKKLLTQLRLRLGMRSFRLNDNSVITTTNPELSKKTLFLKNHTKK